MPQYTLNDIDQRVLSRLDNNELLYPIQQRYREINDALRVINLFTGFCQGDVSVPGFTVPGQQIYMTPPGILWPLRVYFEGRQLDKLSVRAISMKHRNWTTDTTNRASPVQRWVPMGIGMFGIHPIDLTGGKNLLVNGFLEPVPLAAAGDAVTIEDEWIDMVEDLAAHVLPIKESAAIFAASSVIYQKFQRDIKQKTWAAQFKMPRYFVKLFTARQAAESGGDT